MLNKEDLNKINELFADIGATRSYSGRGMYGATCLGVSTDDTIGKFVADAIDQAELFDVDLTALAWVFRRMRSDSLGLGSILYFPGVAYVGDDSEDNDE